MSTTPPSIPPAPIAGAPASPTIPLTPVLRAAYEDLYTKYETAIESSTDPGVIAALSASQANVDGTLTLDNMYRLKAITALYNALLQQINSTNDELKALQRATLSLHSG